MGLGDFFKRKFASRQTDAVDPVSGLTLDRMKTGYYVDYDMKTWQVVSTNRYDWGEGDLTHEWQMESHDETLFLELEPDDENYWTISRKRSFRDLDPGVRAAITQSDAPPEEIEFEGKQFFLDETGGALFFKDNAPGREVFKWDYADDSGDYFLTIEQWGETEYELSVGKKAEEYQFSNILPNA
jgi:hypothetical protein